MKKLNTLFKICSLVETLFIIWHHFVTKKLPGLRPDLQRLLIFINDCVQNNISIINQNGHLLLSWYEPGFGKAQCYVRKYSRDILVFNDFFIQRDYDPIVSRLKNRQQFKLIVDAGANIGCATLYYHYNFPRAEIISIEPEASNFKMLEKNIGLTSAKITAEQKALWSESTQLELMQRDWSDDGFLVMKSEKQDEVIATVAAISVPDILSTYEGQNIDLLKIDIEGAEKELFQDVVYLKQFLPRVNALIMEVHEEFIKAKEIIDNLKEFNFDCEQIQITGQPVAIIAQKKSA
jgi:FkbM family methyltransferase